MLLIKFLDGSETRCVFSNMTDNIVQLRGKNVNNSSGFKVHRESDGMLLGDYSDFTTIYKEIENGVQISNDGSVYVEPMKKVIFNSTAYGSLDGLTSQEAYYYEDLVIPTPIADEDCEFVEWMPEIPTKGTIDTNKTFTAVFVSNLPLEPTLEERLTKVEEQSTMLSMTVDGILTDVIPSLM